MPFSEATKLKVKKQADFTCCWCRDPRNKVEVHHIIPQAESGPDMEDNAAPLCGNCHTLYGGNPELRKEVKDRRDHWYEICLRKLEFAWPIGLHVPLLDSFEEILPPIEKSAGGTNIVEGPPRLELTDKMDRNGTPSLYLSVSFNTASSISPFPRSLRIGAEVPLGLALSLEVCAWDGWDVTGFMNILRNNTDLWILRGYPIEGNEDHPMHQPRDYFSLMRKSTSENKLVAGAYMPTRAHVAIRARFTDEVSNALADYLEKSGFTQTGAG